MILPCCVKVSMISLGLSLSFVVPAPTSCRYYLRSPFNIMYYLLITLFQAFNEPIKTISISLTPTSPRPLTLRYLGSWIILSWLSLNSCSAITVPANLFQVLLLLDIVYHLITLLQSFRHLIMIISINCPGHYLPFILMPWPLHYRNHLVNLIKYIFIYGPESAVGLSMILEWLTHYMASAVDINNRKNSYNIN